MKIRLHIVHEANPQLLQRLDAMYTVLECIEERQSRLQDQLNTNKSNQETYMATIKELVASVREVKGNADSIGMLISQLREQIAGLIAGNLPPDVQAQVDQAFADAEEAKADLSAAVDAGGNTGDRPTLNPEHDAPGPANTGVVGGPNPVNFGAGGPSNPTPGMPFPNPTQPPAGSPLRTDAERF